MLRLGLLRANGLCLFGRRVRQAKQAVLLLPLQPRPARGWAPRHRSPGRQGGMPAPAREVLHAAAFLRGGALGRDLFLAVHQDAVDVLELFCRDAVPASAEDKGNAALLWAGWSTLFASAPRRRLPRARPRNVLSVRSSSRPTSPCARGSVRSTAPCSSAAGPPRAPAARITRSRRFLARRGRAQGHAPSAACAGSPFG